LRERGVAAVVVVAVGDVGKPAFGLSTSSTALLALIASGVQSKYTSAGVR
jgi:hypothetical protein